MLDAQAILPQIVGDGLSHQRCQVIGPVLSRDVDHEWGVGEHARQKCPTIDVGTRPFREDGISLETEVGDVYHLGRVIDLYS